MINFISAKDLFEKGFILEEGKKKLSKYETKAVKKAYSKTSFEITDFTAEETSELSEYLEKVSEAMISKDVFEREKSR